MLGRGVAAEIAERGPGTVWAPEVAGLLGACEATIANLECCISARGRRTERLRGKPFFFRAPPVAIESLRAIGVGAVGLANNHALDYEREALEDTLELLAGAEIAVAGAGRDQRQARRGVVIHLARFRIGLVAVSDDPTGFAAGPKAPGIAYADLARGIPDWLGAEIARLRTDCDLVLAFPHWGPNMTTAPAAWQRRAAALLHAAGADLVAGHSAHVFHGVAWEERGPTLFDLGDALDDYRVDPTLRNDLGIAAIWRPLDTGPELELVGLHLDYALTRLARGADAEWIGDRLQSACEALGTRIEPLDEARYLVRPG